MIEMRLRDGTTFDPADADWTLRVPSSPEIVYGWPDVALILMLEPTYDVVEGMFGPPGQKGMPIRGTRYTDASDLVVEVPMPLAAAREMGGLLAASKIEVVRALPTSLVYRQRSVEKPRGS